MRPSLLTASCHLLFDLALASNSTSSHDDAHLTRLAKDLNKKIEKSTGGTYRGGSNPGVMVRSPDFFDQSSHPPKVAPGTMWHNDINAPSQMYPWHSDTHTISSPWCPNRGSDGFYNTAHGGCNHGPWELANVGVVIGSDMHRFFHDFDSIQSHSWRNAVFYPADSNSCDQRCIWKGHSEGYDCPGGTIFRTGEQFHADSSHHGAGNYGYGNYDAGGGGGGAGCHFDQNLHAIDQADATGSHGRLTGNANCECNYDYAGDWGAWVDTWIKHTQTKIHSRDWLNGNGKKAPVWALDVSVCWIDNPRDMIELQNHLYWRKADWNNQKIPESDWSSHSASEERIYWGWNEIPIDTENANNPHYWDAIIIKLPAGLCSETGYDDEPSCLSSYAKDELEKDLKAMVDNGKLRPGHSHINDHPGSSVLFVREWHEHSSHANKDWQRQFFCKGWTSPNSRYKVVHENDECYLDNYHQDAIATVV